MRSYSVRQFGASAALRALMVFCLMGSASRPAEAAKLEEARVTRAVNDVNLLPENSSPIPAKRGNVISGRTALSTGDRSRAELEFADESLVRLGSNSIFGFKAGERELELQQGSLLLQIPKGRGKTKIKSLPITAAITGTTILFESSKPVRNARGKEIKPGVVKLIVMEGSLEWSFNATPRKKLKMVSGDMVAFPANARSFPQKVKVDLARIKNTSLLMEGGLGKLPDMTRVDRQISTQKRTARSGGGSSTREFLLKSPKPEKVDNRVREVKVAERPRPIINALRRIIKPSKPDSGTTVAPPVPVVVPVRPERCPQDSLDHLCRMPGFGAGVTN